MPSSRQLIASQVLGSSAASVTFSAIPATFTDLVVRFSVRSDAAVIDSLMLMNLNSSSVNISCTYLYSTYSSGVVQSGRDSAATTAGIGWFNGASSTSNTFSSGEIYLPNYTASTAKPFSNTIMLENNATQAYGWTQASFANTTSAITSITLSRSNFVSGSSFYLYGLSS